MCGFSLIYKACWLKKESTHESTATARDYTRYAHIMIYMLCM